LIELVGIELEPFGGRERKRELAEGEQREAEPLAKSEGRRRNPERKPQEESWWS